MTTDRGLSCHVLEKQTVVTTDGKDITEMVEKAVAWLTEHSF